MHCPTEEFGPGILTLEKAVPLRLSIFLPTSTKHIENSVIHLEEILVLIQATIQCQLLQ